jgi:hypothetical protein
MSSRADRAALTRVVDALCSENGNVRPDAEREAARLGPELMPAVRTALARELSASRRAKRLLNTSLAVAKPAAGLFFIVAVPTFLVMHAIWMEPLVHRWALHASLLLGIGEIWLLVRAVRYTLGRLTVGRATTATRRVKALARLAADWPTNDAVPVLFDLLQAEITMDLAAVSRSLVRRLKTMDRTERDRLFELNRRAIDEILSGRRTESLHGLLGTLTSLIEQDRRAEHIVAIRRIVDGIAVTTNGLRTWQGAKSCLPILEEEARVRQSAAHLVRAVEIPEHTLLRPVGTPGESSSDVLLRATTTES